LRFRAGHRRGGRASAARERRVWRPCRLSRLQTIQEALEVGRNSLPL
jgi:hypothetical protein